MRERNHGASRSVDLDAEKRGKVAITYITHRPGHIEPVLAKASIDPGQARKAWNDDRKARVRPAEIIEREIKVEGDLRREIS